MTVLIAGGAGSGKSAFAERLAVQLARTDGTTPFTPDGNLPPDESGGVRLLYIATMEPFGDEAAARIAKHREQRRNLDFVTVERYRDLAGLDVSDFTGPASSCGCVALLEDLGNLCANELFRPEGQCAVPQAEDAVLSGLGYLRSFCSHLVVVTNEVFCGGAGYAGDTDAWLRLLASVNRKAAALSEGVCEVVCGVPCWIRDPWGREPAFSLL